MPSAGLGAANTTEKGAARNDTRSTQVEAYPSVTVTAPRLFAPTLDEPQSSMTSRWPPAPRLRILSCRRRPSVPSCARRMSFEIDTTRDVFAMIGLAAILVIFVVVTGLSIYRLVRRRRLLRFFD